MEEYPPEAKVPIGEPTKAADKGTEKGRRNIILGGAAGLVIICGCLAALVAGLLVIDPFGWQLADRISGRYDPVASAMPADTALYIGIDVLAFNPQKLNRVLRPFLEVADQTDFSDAEDALDDFDAELESELGLAIQDDILPWVGQYAGLGVSNIQTDSFGDLERLNLVAAISTRDRGASDDFLEKLAAGVSASTGRSFSEQMYQGVAIYVMNSDDPLERLAFARKNSLVLIATGLTDIERAIDVQSGQSLAGTEDYQTVVRELPGGRGLTFYLDGGRLEELGNVLGNGFGTDINPASVPLIEFKGAALAVSIVDEGLKLDWVTTSGTENLTDAARELAAAGQPAESADQQFPEQTVALLSGQRLDLTWEAIRQDFVAENSQADWDEAMRLFADEFGLNPDQDLMALLDGAWGVGILPGNRGLLAEELEVALGFAALAGTSDADSISSGLTSLADGLDFQGFTVEPQESPTGVAFNVSLSAGDNPVLLYGLENDLVFIASDPDTARRVVSIDGPRLSDSDRYQQVWDTFPAGHTPTLYIDVQGLVGAILEGLTGFDRQDFDQVAQVSEPLTFIAATSDVVISGSDLIRHFAMIFFVDQTE